MDTLLQAIGTAVAGGEKMPSITQSQGILVAKMVGNGDFGVTPWESHRVDSVVSTKVVQYDVAVGGVVVVKVSKTGTETVAHGSDTHDGSRRPAQKYKKRIVLTSFMVMTPKSSS